MHYHWNWQSSQAGKAHYRGETPWLIVILPIVVFEYLCINGHDALGIALSTRMQCVIFGWISVNSRLRVAWLDGTVLAKNNQLKHRFPFLYLCAPSESRCGKAKERLLPASVLAHQEYASNGHWLKYKRGSLENKVRDYVYGDQSLNFSTRTDLRRSGFDMPFGNWIDHENIFVLNWGWCQCHWSRICGQFCATDWKFEEVESIASHSGKDCSHMKNMRRTCKLYTAAPEMV